MQRPAGPAPRKSHRAKPPRPDRRRHRPPEAGDRSFLIMDETAKR